jgi:transcription-repair coupling factor (superfamily II helicase)
VKQSGDSLLLYQRTLDLDLGSRLSAALPGRVMISAGSKPYLAVKGKGGLTSLDILREAMQAAQRE